MQPRQSVRQTIVLKQPPRVAGWASLAGRFEGQGPLGDSFDRIVDDLHGGKTWEQSESRMMEDAVHLCLEKYGHALTDVDLMFAGDLLNQIVSANFAARQLALPFFGLFSACAVSAEAMALGAMLIDSGHFERIMVATASHHLTAERQYRFPIEFGVQRLPTQAWTATGAVAVLLAAAGTEFSGPRLTALTTGVVTDLGIKDPNHMGAAMAPAAAGTIAAHLQAMNEKPGDYDMILTGDLGRAGKPLLDHVLMEDHGISLGERLHDAGIELYDAKQDVHSGGSGPACSALVLAARVLPGLQSGELKRVLFVATGSLHSPTTYQQGESVPGIAHAVCLEA